jgi:hypothetical protein
VGIVLDSQHADGHERLQGWKKTISEEIVYVGRVLLSCRRVSGFPLSQIVPTFNERLAR